MELRTTWRRCDLCTHSNLGAPTQFEKQKKRALAICCALQNPKAFLVKSLFEDPHHQQGISNLPYLGQTHKLWALGLNQVPEGQTWHTNYNTDMASRYSHAKTETAPPPPPATQHCITSGTTYRLVFNFNSTWPASWPEHRCHDHNAPTPGFLLSR